MKRRYVCLGIMVALVACGGSKPQFTLTMKPRSPLSLANCVAEVTRFTHGSTLAARDLCELGKRRVWYHAVLRNGGDAATPSCKARGFDAAGRSTFDGYLFFTFAGGPPGLYLENHQRLVFDWYLIRHTRGPIKRYEATCEVNENPAP